MSRHGNVSDRRLRGVALRPDLQVSHQKRDGKEWVVIQDPLRHRFYEMGKEDYGMAVRIRDGATLEEVIAEWRQALPERCEGCGDAELRRHAERLIGTVKRLGLGGTNFPSGAASVKQGSWIDWVKGGAQRVAGLLFWRVRLWDPDVWLGRRVNGVEGIRRWAVILSAVVLVSLGFALGDAGAMALHPEWFGRWENLVALYVGLFGLKVVHEAGHALVCKSMGGRVPEVGMQMVVVHPTFYVDVSETWMWADRSRRIAVAAAGIGAELVAAAGLFWCWKLLGPGFLKDLSLQLAFTASVLAILFNANPLMRYDGYHILTDLVGEPRLRQKAFGYWERILRWMLLGGEPWPKEKRGLLLGLYGFFSVGYLGVVVVAVGRMLNRVLEPIGLEAAARLFLGAWLLALGIPVVAFLFRLVAEIRDLDEVRRRTVVLRLTIALVAGMVVLGMPLPVTVERQGVLETPVEGAVRAVESGFIREVHVREGDWVKPGQVLVHVENRVLEAGQRAADLEVKVARVSLQAAQATQAVAELDAARRHLEEARAQAAEAGRRVEALVLVAPVEGRVVTRDLGRRQGNLVRAGEEVVSVVPAGKNQVLLPLSEKEARQVFESAIVRFRPTSEPSKEFAGKITSAPLRVTDGLLPPALSVLSGGDIVLDGNGRPVSGEVTHLSRLTFESGNVDLWPGGTGRVRLECGRLPVARWVFRRVLEAVDLGHRL